MLHESLHAIWTSFTKHQLLVHFQRELLLYTITEQKTGRLSDLFKYKV